MNIQPSVILWTVICFFALMAILNYLLLQPILKILDERKKQLAMARQKKQEHEQLIAEQARQREAQKQELAQKQAAKIQQTVEQIQAKEKALMKEAHRECLSRINLYKEEREQELQQILTAFRPKMVQVAELFAQQIVSERD